MDPTKEPCVKGSIMIDYLKIVRANPDLPWADHLAPEDLEQMDQMVLPSSWYPAGLFDRVGTAIFKLVSKENMDIVRSFGRMVGDKMNKENPGMVHQGDASSTLTRFLAIQARLYSYKFFEKRDSGGRRVLIDFFPYPGIYGTQLLVQSLAGTMERLAELSGAANINTRLIESIDDGADKSSLEISWEGQ